MEYTYERFLQNNPSAILLAEKKLHPKLDNAYMRIYSYDFDGKFGYIFRFEELMVTNPIIFDSPIPYNLLSLFCYEWFLEYEKVSGVKEMVENDGDFYSTPNHMNIWDFSSKWYIRYSNHWQFKEGEKVRKRRKLEAFHHLEELKKYASKQELIEIKKELEELLLDL